MKTCQDFAVKGQQMHYKEHLLLFSQSGTPAQERAGGNKRGYRGLHLLHGRPSDYQIETFLQSVFQLFAEV